MFGYDKINGRPILDDFFNSVNVELREVLRDRYAFSVFIILS